MLPVIRRTVSIIILVICAILGLWYYLNPIFNPKPLTLNNATVLTAQHVITDFNLVDTNNQPFTQYNLRGHWTLLFFGYTNCPDICPATLNILRAAWDMFPNSKPAKFVFISINPSNDSTAALKTFLSRFHPDFIGATGKDAAVKQLSEQLGIYANKNDNVIIDHTAALMLINPQGRLHAIFTPPLTPRSLAQDLVTITKANPAILKQP